MPGLSIPIPPQPPKVPEWRRPVVWMQAVIGTVFGGLLMFMALSTVRNFGAWEAVALCMALPVILWLQILAHEAGHAVAGLMAGHRVLAVGIGPLKAERGRGSWRIRWSGHLRSIAGFVLLLPRTAAPSRWESTAYLLGGPLANLLVAALAVPWAMPDPGQATTIGHAVARIVAGTGVMVGVINLMPFLVGGWSSDGRQLFKLWQGSEEARAMSFLGQLGALYSTGIRPKDWPMSSMADVRLDELPQSIADALAQCRLYKAIDERQLNTREALTAAQALASGFWRGPEVTRPTKALVLSRWLLESGGDLTNAQAWSELAEGGLLDQSGELAALRAKMALRNGSLLEAEHHHKEAVALRHRVQEGAGLTMFDEDLAMIGAQLIQCRNESVAANTFRAIR